MTVHDNLFSLFLNIKILFAFLHVHAEYTCERTKVQSALKGTT